MEETDWDNVVDTIKDLLEEVDGATTTLCEQRFFKACTVISGKVVPILKGLLREAEVKKEMRELAEEEGVEEGEIPEIELTAEQRARLEAEEEEED